MACSCQFTPLAQQDLDASLAYILHSLSNPGAAKALYQEVEKTLSGICAFPYAYPDCSRFLIEDTNIRHALVGNYLLIYEIERTGQSVRILRFLYSGRDIAGMPVT